MLGTAVLLSIFWLAGGREDMQPYVIVTQQNIGGLNPQAQVRYRGVRVGKVRDIRLDPDDASNTLVSIEISRHLPLTTGTVARLNYQGVTGLAHILLFERSKGQPALPTSATAPARITMVPSLMDELSEHGLASLDQARELIASANDVLNQENRRHLTATLKNLEAASASLAPALENMTATLGQMRKLLDDQNIRQLSAAASEVGPLLGESRTLIGKMQSATDKFDLAVGDASAGGTAALMPRLNELAKDFSLTSRQLSRVLRILEDSPQGLVFGAPALPPGPGEPGFSPPGAQ